jgi:endoglucanase
VPPHPWRPPRRRALLLAALAAGLVPGAVATAGAAPGQGDPAVTGRLVGAQAASAAASVGDALAALARSTQVRGASPFAGGRIYRAPRGPARAQARAWRRDRPADAALIDRIALQPAALWLGDWTRDVRRAAARRIRAARAARAVPVLVAYNIPGRDLGLHSAGGAPGTGDYLSWIEDLAAGIGAGPAAVVLEPDALAGLDALSEGEGAGRTALLAEAVARLASRPGVAVYVDAGNPAWTTPAEMARRLRAAGVAGARGFAVNVSSFHTTAHSRAYGRAVSRRVGGAPFVIDTSRNGAGPAPGGAWCNPPGRALGQAPTAETGDAAVDALLWIKRPGESDGPCNGGPPAGAWWPEGALALARAAEG